MSVPLRTASRLVVLMLALAAGTVSTAPVRAGGSDIVRIIRPDGLPGRSDPTPAREDVPLPVRPKQGPGTPRTEPPRPNPLAGRFVKVPVQLGTLASDASKAWLGVNLENDYLDRAFAISVGLMNPNGALVTDVTPAGPASRAGLRAGDIIVSLNGAAIANSAQLRQYLAQNAPGAQATVEAWRFVPEGSDYIAELRRMGEQGNAAVMAMLGSMHAGGKGVARDDAEAVRWYRAGADAGHAVSMIELANLTIEGRGTERNAQEAVRLYRSAADTGNPYGMWRYGFILLEGKLVPKDTAQAAQLFQRGVDSGFSPAMYDLAVMHANGIGMPRNYQEAARLYQKAVDLNNSAAMVNLGLLYSEGKGVEMNEVRTVELYRRAVDLNQPSAMQNLAAMLDNGRGVPQRDPEQAADLVLRAMRFGNEFSYRQMLQNHAAYTREFRMSVQRRLKDEGLYTGYIDGEFGQSTQGAVTAYYRRYQDVR
ncbi:MAG: PDZ domain-containing protein [Hyphomicrobiaceae bacterium]|nr:PDZ domain-containing protein [Hyphomicrobiaceae bacterium]